MDSLVNAGQSNLSLLKVKVKTVFYLGWKTWQKFEPQKDGVNWSQMRLSICNEIASLTRIPLNCLIFQATTYVGGGEGSPVHVRGVWGSNWPNIFPLPITNRIDVWWWWLWQYDPSLCIQINDPSAASDSASNTLSHTQDHFLHISSPPSSNQAT